MKDEALKLADWLDKDGKSKEYKHFPNIEASTMIRRLVEELDCAESYIKQYQLQTKPLSDEKIHSMWDKLESTKSIKIKYWRFARAIEKEHGIK